MFTRSIQLRHEGNNGPFFHMTIDWWRHQSLGGKGVLLSGNANVGLKTFCQIWKHFHPRLPSYFFLFFKLLFLEFLLLTSSSNVNRNIEDEINLYCRIANFNNHLHDPSFDVIENRVRKNREIICLKKNSWSTISWAFLKARNFPEMYIGSKTERLYIENGFGSQKEFATSRYYWIWTNIHQIFSINVK